MLLLHVRNDHVAELRAEAQLVDLVREGMVVLVLEEVLQVVYVQVAVRERLSGSNVKVAHDLVDADAALETAPFLTLSIEVLGVVFAFTLFDTLPAAKGPRNRGVGVAYFGARVAASGFDSVLRRGGAIALSTVVGREMRRFVFVSRQLSALLLPHAYGKSEPEELTDPVR
jgi:hypothetical protein